MCDKPVPFAGAETSDNEGARLVSLDSSGAAEVRFPITPSKLTLFKVTPPEESKPRDIIAITVEYTLEDDTVITKVSV